MKTPTTFISYSWTSPEFEQKIIKLAEDLVSQGVKVTIDKWDLREGHDSYAFMEKMVNDPEIEKVVIACDKAYAEKSKSRKGGVGVETQIISPELYNKQEQDKFVAVVFEKDHDGNAYLPTYYSSRIYIDFSNPENEAVEFEKLVRWFYGKPIYKSPELGMPPSYILNDDQEQKMATSVTFKRAVDAIRTNKSYSTAAVLDYFENFIAEMSNFAADKEAKPFDDEVIKLIAAFTPYRNELISIFETLAKYSVDDTFVDATHTFLEQLYNLSHRDENTSRYNDWDWDVVKFIQHELLLYIIAILIKRKRYDAAASLINNGYLVKMPHQPAMLKEIGIFRTHLKSLDFRNDRLKKGRVSIHSDLLKERCTGLSVSFNELMQADFVLFLACTLQTNDHYWSAWFPITLLYAERYSTGFELFVRSEKEEHLKNLLSLLKIESIGSLNDLVLKVRSGEIRKIDFGGFNRVDIEDLLNWEKLSAAHLNS